MRELGRAMSHGNGASANGICSDEHGDDKCVGCMMRQLSVCRHLSAAALEELKKSANFVTFAKSKLIVEQGEPLENVYFIRSGMVGLHRLLHNGDRRVTGFLGPGDILSGIKNRNGAYCTAMVISEVVACRFDRQNFISLLQSQSELGVIMLLTATDEIEAQNDHNILLSRKHVLERLAAFLLIVASRWEHHGQTDTLNLPASRADIADYCGLTIESVSRGLTELRSKGVISMPTKSSIVLENSVALHDLAHIDDIPVGRVGVGL